MTRHNGARLGDALLEAGWVTERSISKALELQASFGGRLGTNLLEIGALREGELLSTLGRLRHTQTVEAEGFQAIPPDLLRLVPPKLAKRFEIVPVRRSGGTLLVASIDPGNALAEDELSAITGSMVRTVIGLEIRVRAALEQYYRLPQSVRLTALSRRLDGRGSGVISLPDQASLAAAAESNVLPLPDPSFGASSGDELPSLEPASLEPVLVESVLAEPVLAEQSHRGTALVAPEQVSRESSAPVESKRPDAAPTPAVTERPMAEKPVAEALGEQAIARQRPQPPLRAEPIREVAISDEEYANIFGPGNGADQGSHGAKAPESDVTTPAGEDGAGVSTDPEARLEATANRLARAGMRDDVADALLAFCRPDLDRRFLLIRRGQQVLGWRGEGSDVDAAMVRTIEIDAAMPSLFGNLTENPQFWTGPLPPFPAHAALLAALGEAPDGCVVGPLVVRGKVIGFLYADNGSAGVTNAPIAQLERLVRMAGLALEVALLKNKIRTL